jgi:hypothetical protein
MTRIEQWGAVAHPPPSSPRLRPAAPGEGNSPYAPVPGRAGLTVRTESAARSQSRMVRRAARRARGDASIVKVVPLLAVMVVTVAGIYIAWHKGSAGGGEGGAIGGAALLTAAVARLLLPAQLAGLLATRKRSLDVITLAFFGTCLLAAGLVLPR